MMKRSQSATERLICDTLKSSHPGEQIRCQMQLRDNVMGYAVEVTREIAGNEYSYVGWISALVIRTQSEPWPADQRHMIERAFQASYEEVTKRGVH